MAAASAHWAAAAWAMACSASWRFCRIRLTGLWAFVGSTSGKVTGGSSFRGAAVRQVQVGRRGARQGCRAAARGPFLASPRRAVKRVAGQAPRSSRFQATTTTPSTTSSAICQPAPVAAPRRRRGMEGVPQVEGQRQQGRADQPRDGHRPDRRGADGDGRRVGRAPRGARRGRSRTRSAAARYPSRNAMTASPMASARRSRLGQRATAAAVRAGRGEPTGDRRGDADEAEERDDQGRDEDGRPAFAVEALPASRGCVPRGPGSAPTMRPVSSSAGTSHSPNGTSRIAPTQATAATDGRMSDSIGTPSPRLARAVSSPRTWSVPRSIAPSRKIATNQTAGGSTSRDRPTTVTAARARSRRASRAARCVGGEATRPGAAHVPLAGLPATHASRSARERVFRTSAGLDPRPARLADAPVR